MNGSPDTVVSVGRQALIGLILLLFLKALNLHRLPWACRSLTALGGELARGPGCLHLPQLNVIVQGQRFGDEGLAGGISRWPWLGHPHGSFTRL